MPTANEIAASIRARRLSRTRQRLSPYLYVLPALAALGLWNYYPLVFLFGLSFHKLDASSPVPSWVGFANYSELFTDPLFWRALRNTAIYTLIAVPLSIALGLALAVALNQRLAGAWLLRTLLYTPVVLPTVAAATVALWIFNTNYGLANYLLELVGQPPVAWLTDSGRALWTIVAIGVWKTFGYFMLVYLAALQAAAAGGAGGRAPRRRAGRGTGSGRSRGRCCGPRPGSPWSLASFCRFRRSTSSTS